MPHAHVLERVRETVKKVFAAQGVTSFPDFSEAILIRDGYYCGRSFSCGGWRGVWFVEENRLKFFDRENRLFHSQSADEADKSIRTAS